MPKILSTLAGSLLIWVILVWPVVAQHNTAVFASDNNNGILQDIIDDYALYTSLLSEVYIINQYRISLHAHTPDEAAAYLAQGFDPDLAHAMTNYYLQWLPGLRKMAVIPTDSIPIITAADKPYVSIVRISPKKAILQRIYTDCYEIGDKYAYLITAEQKGEKWIIIDLRLECLRTNPALLPATSVEY